MGTVEKVGVYNALKLLHALEDSSQKFFVDTCKFREDTRLKRIRILLGLICSAIAAYSWFFAEKWPETYNANVACVLSYAVVYVFVQHYSLVDNKHIIRLKQSSKLPAFGVSIQMEDGEEEVEIGLESVDGVHSFSKKFPSGKWVDSDGMFYESIAMADLGAVMQSFQSVVNKKST